MKLKDHERASELIRQYQSLQTAKAMHMEHVELRIDIGGNGYTTLRVPFEAVNHLLDAEISTVASQLEQLHVTL